MFIVAAVSGESQAVLFLGKLYLKLYSVSEYMYTYIDNHPSDPGNCAGKRMKK